MSCLARRTRSLIAAALVAATSLTGLAVAATAAPAPARPAAHVPHLSIRGTDLVLPDGHPVVLRGWNWGHWGSAQQVDAAANVAQGANSVRLMLRWWGFYQGRGVDSRDDNATQTAGIDPAHLRILDENVRWATDAHLWIILFIDSDCGQNGTQNPQEVQYCDPQGKYPNGHNFFTDPQARAKFLNVWRFIANRYKDNPYIAMWEPLPEPGSPSTSPDEIKAFYTEAMNAIREVAPGIPFLVGPQTYRAAKIDSIYNPAWKDVVYTGNLFLHSGGPEGGVEGIRTRLQGLVRLRAQHNVPIFVQQVGVRTGDDDVNLSSLKAVLGLLVDNKVGFSYWEYRGSLNPAEYAALYQDGDRWMAKANVVNTIGGYFKK